MSADQNMEDDTAVVGLAEDAADVRDATEDEIIADSDEDSGGSDEDVPDAPEDDYESDGEGQEWSLGFCVEAPADELQRQFFPSKVGGRPAWLDPVDVPTALQLKCLYTREPLDFLLQVYAPGERRRPERVPPHRLPLRVAARRGPTQTRSRASLSLAAPAM